MKTFLGPAIVLSVLSAGLAVGWFHTSKTADADRSAASQLAQDLTNQVNKVSADLAESKAVNTEMRSTVERQSVQLTTLSNQVQQRSSDLAATSAKLDEAQTKARADAESAQAELSKREQRIAGLVTNNEDLTRQLAGLNQQIAALDGKISEYRRQLAESEGDRTVLLTHLRSLQSEKSELERKFQDLDTLREEYRRVRQEQAIARRQEFRRKDAYGFERKGAELIQTGIKKPAAAKPNPDARTLKVETDTTGKAKVVPNSPATASPQP